MTFQTLQHLVEAIIGMNIVTRTPHDEDFLPSNSNFTSFFIRFWSALICLSMARLFVVEEELDDPSRLGVGLLLKFPIAFGPTGEIESVRERKR